MLKNKIILTVLLALYGCQANPGPFVGKVKYKLKHDGEARVSVYSKEYGYFSVYNYEFFDKLHYEDKIMARCNIVRSIFGGPYRCQIIERKTKNKWERARERWNESRQGTASKNP